MNPDWPILKSALMILALGAALLLSGCQFQPKPVSATSYSDDKDVIVQVTLRAADAQTIKTRELYFSLNVINCDGPANGFPAAPFSIAGKPARGFDFPIQGDTVQIASRVPAHIFAQYSEPCVFLQGGGYFTGTIESIAIPIVRDQRAGGEFNHQVQHLGNEL